MGNINNPFVAKNGLKIVDSNTISGVTYSNLENNDNILPTSGLIYRELTGKTDFNIFSAHTGNTSIHHTLQSLDNRYVNVSGDTINGNLNIIGNLSATTISATTFYGSNSITTTVKTNLATFDLPYDNGITGGTKTINWNNGNIQKLTLTANTILTFTDVTSRSYRVQLHLIQDGTGGFTITLPANVKDFNGTATPITLAAGTANQEAIVTLFFDGIKYFMEASAFIS